MNIRFKLAAMLRVFLWFVIYGFLCFLILGIFVGLSTIIWSTSETPVLYIIFALSAPIVLFIILCVKKIRGKLGVEKHIENDTPLQQTSPNIIAQYIDQAADVVFDTSQASVSILQRNLRLGYLISAQIMDELESRGVVSKSTENLPRRILMTRAEYYSKFKSDIMCGANSDKTFCHYSDNDSALAYIDLMEGHDFEYWCADLLCKNGFINVQVTQGSGDQGVDILASKDGIKYAIQCKCYSHDLGNTPVQEINTGKIIYHCHVGAVMTNRYFTKGAKEAAQASSVLLWDRNTIAKMLESIKK